MKREECEMKKFFRITMLAAAFAAAVSLTAGVDAARAAEKPGAAGQPYEKCGHKDWPMHGKAAWKKTLTAAQKTEIDNLHGALKKETSGVMDELRARKEAARAIVASENPDRDALGRITGEMAALEKELMDARYAHIIKVRSILNAEQKAAFDSAMKSSGKRGR